MLLSDFVALEQSWRVDGVGRFGIDNDSDYGFPIGTLDNHYTVLFLVAWAHEAEFPGSYASAHRSKIAAGLALWPQSFRDAASSLVFSWVAPSLTGANKKLCEAIVGPS